MGGKNSKGNTPTNKQNKPSIGSTSKMTAVREDLANDEAQYLQAIRNSDMATATKLANSQGFEKLQDGRLLGYRVSRQEGDKAVSGADSRQASDIAPGSVIQFQGNGAYLAANPRHAIDYYAVHDNNVIQKVAFKPEDIISGNTQDSDATLSVSEGEVLDSETFADGEEPKRLNQIAPIAYDNDGNIMPLSARFYQEPFEGLPSQDPSRRYDPDLDEPLKMGAPVGGIGSTSRMATDNKVYANKSPISNIVAGNASSPTFVQNAEARGMTPEAWQQHLDETEAKMLEADANDEFAMSDDEFNKAVGDTVIENLKARKANMEGQVETLPNKGKVIIIGDLHEQNDNLLAILKDIQANPETNLDNNPDVKILFLGDVFSTTKPEVGSTPAPISGDNIKDKSYSEVTNRLLTMLMAKYPDQIHSVMGNHDIGVLTANLYNQDPNYKLAEAPDKAALDAIDNDPNLSQEEKDLKKRLGEHYEDSRNMLLTDAQSSSGLTTGAMTNNEHAVAKIQNEAMAVVIGDKSKGEKVRLFIHSPLGGDLTPGLDGLKGLQSVETLLKNPDPITVAALQTLFAGHGNVRNPDEIKKTLERLGVDEVYFGHMNPKGLMEKVDKRQPQLGYQKDASGNYVLGVNKTDGINSPIGSIEGGAHLIDSQSKGDTSGYMVLDLDNDTKDTRLMSDVIKRTDAENDPAIQKVIHAAQNIKSTADPAALAALRFRIMFS